MNDPLRRGPAGALARPLYEPGHYLAYSDRVSEQRYFLQRLRRHNRRLHGWGVVCGLWVVPLLDAHRPWALQVCPGYALGPYGDEIFVPTPAPVDVANYLWMLPLGSKARVAHVGIRYAEELVMSRPVPSASCGCDDPVYAASRVRDGYEVDILWELGRATSDPDVDICGGEPTTCPECPDSPYVWLACVHLPASQSDPITGSQIENWVCS